MKKLYSSIACIGMICCGSLQSEQINIFVDINAIPSKTGHSQNQQNNIMQSTDTGMIALTIDNESTIAATIAAIEQILNNDLGESVHLKRLHDFKGTLLNKPKLLSKKLVELGITNDDPLDAFIA